MRQVLAALGPALGLALGAALAPAADPTPAELVARLGADDYRTREAAAAALERHGPAAVPALLAALDSPDPEVRRRAAPVLLKLRRAADSAERLAPRRVRLEYRAVPLGQAVTDLRARTGLPVTIDPARVADPLRPVTCVTPEVPVWEAVEALAAAAGLVEEFRPELDVPKVQISGRRAFAPAPSVPAPDAVPVVLVDGTRRPVPGARGTAVRVSVPPPSFAGHRATPGTGDVTLCLDVAPVPGLNWQDVVAVKVTKLVDDHGRFGGGGAPPAFDAPPGPFEDFGIVAPAGGIVALRPGLGVRWDPRTGAALYPDTVPNPRTVAVPLKVPTPTARALRRLEGKLFGEVTLTNQTLVTVPDPAKRVGTAFDGPGGVRVSVQGATVTPGGDAQYQVRLEYPSPWVASARRGLNPGGLFPEAPRPPGHTPTVQARDAAGKPLQSAPSLTNYTDTSDDGQTLIQHLTLTYRKGTGPVAQLVVTGPRPVVVEVPFAFENVPLP